MASTNRVQVTLRNAIFFLILQFVADAQIYRSECRRDVTMKVTDRGKKLTGVMEEIRVSSLPHCVRGCVNESLCNSINYKKVTANIQGSNCELLSTSRAFEGTSLIAAPGWLHYEPIVQMNPRCRLVTCNPGYICVEKCDLPAGYRCIDIDECASDPCRNGGACINRVNMYSCTCSQEYFGTNCELVNVARGKATAQSSIFDGLSASRAVDGNGNADINAGSCACTHADASAWWRVDLGLQYTIGTVRITNRLLFWDRLSNFDVKVGRTVSSYSLCYYFSGTVASAARVALPCTSKLVGRYVLVALRSSNHLQLCEVQVFPKFMPYTSCRETRLATGTVTNGIYDLSDSSRTSTYKAYCHMSQGGWTLIARFSNADVKNWVATSGSYWYDQTAVGSTTNPSANSDMISKAFYNAKGTDIKLTRSDSMSHSYLLYSSGCLSSMTFRSKITSYGNFRNNASWSNDQCLGNCNVNNYSGVSGVSGFSQYNCSGSIQSSHQIGFWCHYGAGDGAVIMIGGGGSSCERADHGIAITESNSSRFGTYGTKDFGDHMSGSSSYALNIWIR